SWARWDRREAWALLSELGTGRVPGEHRGNGAPGQATRAVGAPSPPRPLLRAATWVAWELATWPDVARLGTERPASTAFIDHYRARQRAHGKPDRIAWTWVPYAAISADLKRAVLVSADINFFSHRRSE